MVLRVEYIIKEIRTLTPHEIFSKYASSEQVNRVDEYRSEYWNLILGIYEQPFKNPLMYQPIEYSVEVLTRWAKQNDLVYLTARPDNTRDFTLLQLVNFRFPLKNVELVMFPLEDFSQAQNGFNGPIFSEIRKNLVLKILEKHKIVVVIDDNATYFPIYMQCKIRDRIGLMRTEAYTIEDFMRFGVTRVIRSW